MIKSLVIITLLSITSLLANSGMPEAYGQLDAKTTQYTNEDRAKDMRTMLKALNQIQSGLIRKNDEDVTSGSMVLTQTIKRVHLTKEEVSEKNFMKRYMNQKIEFRGKIVRKIDKRIYSMLERYKDDDMNQAVQNYSKIVEQCYKCHAKIMGY